jgi:hypothetical protein
MGVQETDMKRFALIVATVCCGALALLAQETRIPQFHGFATQAFTYSRGNNYPGMDTTSGSAAWTEEAINVNEQQSARV